jgi:DNA invertase Pin-like site-specific DNA recombinase
VTACQYWDVTTETTPTGQLLGYARVSTERQCLDRQLDAFAALGIPADRVWTEKMSGRRDDRPELAKLLAYARQGDTIVVKGLDRLGRRTLQVLATVQELRERGIALRILDLGVDVTTPIGQAMLQMLAAVSELEVNLTAERAAEARAARKARGIPVGRPRALSVDEEKRARTLHAAGEGVEAIRDALRRSDGSRPGRSTVYRALAMEDA